MEQIKFLVRMPEDLRDLLKAEAERSVRSLNGEIVYRLRQSIEAQRLDRGATQDELRALSADLLAARVAA